MHPASASASASTSSTSTSAGAEPSSLHAPVSCEADNQASELSSNSHQVSSSSSIDHLNSNNFLTTDLNDSDSMIDDFNEDRIEGFRSWLKELKAAKDHNHDHNTLPWCSIWIDLCLLLAANAVKKSIASTCTCTYPNMTDKAVICYIARARDHLSVNDPLARPLYTERLSIHGFTEVP